MKNITTFLSAILCLAITSSLGSCNNDSEKVDDYIINGTNFSYNVKTTSTSYEPIVYKNPSPSKPQGKGQFTYNGNTFEFQVDYLNKIKITKAVELTNPIVIIPAYIDDRAVATLGEKLFYCNKNAESIVVPCTIENMLDYCFVASNADIYIPSKALTFNTCFNIKKIIYYQLNKL